MRSGGFEMRDHAREGFPNRVSKSGDSIRKAPQPFLVSD